MRLKYFVCVFSTLQFLATFLFSNEEQESADLSKLTHRGSAPSAIVDGCVNVITGAYIEQNVDITINGPEPLSLERSYSSDAGWAIHKVESVYNDFGDLSKFYHVHDGAATHYEKKDSNLYGINPKHFKHGLTNCGSGYLNGRTSPHNNIISNIRRDYKILASGSGTKKVFDGLRPEDEWDAYSIKYCDLSSVHKPNGLSLKYKYKNSPLGYCANSIKTLNQAGGTLNELVFKYESKDVDVKLNVFASDHQSSEYEFFYNSSNRDYNLRVARSSCKPVEFFEYDTSGKLIQKHYPEKRTKKIKYYTEGTNYLEGVGSVDVISVKRGDSNLYVKNRVCSLKAPIGSDDRHHYTHHFIYREYSTNDGIFKGGHTIVFNAYRHPKTYLYNEYKQLTCIEELLNGASYRKQIFGWGTFQKENANLLYSMLCDGDGVHSCSYNRYDISGNILKEELSGIITGKNLNKILIDAQGNPQYNGQDLYSKQYSYTTDGFNLLSYENDGRKEIFYSYAENSDLLLKKLMNCEGIRQREFFHYDANGSVVCHILDDGCSCEQNDLAGMTERRITYTQYRTENPVGLPQVIEEKYLDLSTGQEVLLKRTVNMHDLHGRLVNQVHYDSDANERYFLAWEYDTHHNLVKETDPLGNFKTFTYDDNDNLIFEKQSNLNFHKNYQYDFSNRLIQTEEIHPDKRFVTKHRYDRLNQITATVDALGYETNFTYDALGRVVEKIYPGTFDENGCFYRPKEIFGYDTADNVTFKSSTTGAATHALYNIFGKPYKILYPNGASESNEYTIDGLLEKNCAINGTITNYIYDYLGRVLKKSIHDPKGDLLAETRSIYSPFHLIAEIDPSGEQTSYSYDYAGRLKTVLKGDAKTEYEYDNCGRVSKIKEWFGYGDDDYTVKTQNYDFIDRVTEERTENSSGEILAKVSYEYDSRGNRSKIIHYHLNEPSVTTFEYNDSGDLIKATDAKGNITSSHKNYDFINAEGQNVVTTESVDPLGKTSYTESDSLGRLKFNIEKDSFGNILQKREFFYDQEGNCVKQIEHVITPDQPNRLVIAKFEYDIMGNLIAQIEALGTPEQKITKYEYNLFNQKVAVIKPDGIRLEHTYDYLGRISAFKASDYSFSYTYHYDANSNVILVIDDLNQTETRRCFDSNNRLIEEVLPTKICLKYTYDRTGRVVKETLPDQSEIDYIYESLYLKEIQRKQYKHSYLQFNQSGILESAQLIGNAGKLSYEIDELQRLKKIHTNQWSEIIPDDGYDACGNLIKKTTQDVIGLVESDYSYSKLYQLKSESGVIDHTFEHDSLFNIVQKDANTHAVNALNQLLHDGIEESTYDANGNLIQKGDMHLCYDAMDRLISTEKDSVKVTYLYDELNRRISSSHYKHKQLEKTLYYLYQGQNEIGVITPEGKIEQLRVLGIGKGAEIGASVLIEVNDQTYAPIHDSSGHIRCLINAETGKVEETYRYSSFGEEEIHTSSKKKANNPWRFSSKRTDDETAFVYFGRRYFNPQTARWVTADPMGFEAGPNLYAYVFNNPNTNIDLYGLERESGDSRWERKQYRESSPRCRSGGIESSVNSRGSDPSERHGKSFLDHVKEIPTDIRNYIANTLDFVGHHIMPVPILKDVFQYPAHVARSGCFAGYTPSYSGEHSGYKLAFKGSEEGKIYVHPNGMMNSSGDLELKARAYHDAQEGKYDTYTCYLATKGFVGDLCRSVLYGLGVKTHATEVLESCLTFTADLVGESGTVCLRPHSAGTLASINVGVSLPKSVTDKIEVIGLGGPLPIPHCLYRKCENYAASFDPISVPFAFLNGILNRIGIEFAHSEILPTEGNIFNAHGVLMDTYRKKIR